MAAVQAGQRLYGLDTAQLLIDDHGMQQRLVKTRLIFLRHDEDIALIMEYLLCLGLADMAARGVHIKAAFRILGIIRILRVLDTAGKSHEYFHIIVMLRTQIPLDLMEIADGGQARRGDDHHLALAFDLFLRDITERLDNDGGFLLNVVGMQLAEALDHLQCLGLRDIRVLRYILRQLITGLVGHIVLQYIKDKSFLDGLPHRVDMKRMERAIFILCAELLQRFLLWCRGEGKKGEVLMAAVRYHLTGHTVLCVQQFIFCPALKLRVFFQRVRGVRKSHLHLHSGTTSLGGMCLIDDDRKAFPHGVIYLIIDNGELLQRRNNDTLPIIDCRFEILGRLLLIYRLDTAKGMVKAGHRLLQLRVQITPVRDNDHRGKYRLIRRIVQRCQAVGRPGNRVRLS